MSDAAVDARASPRDAGDPRVQRTRMTLLAACNRLFLKHGYEAISPARIAAEARVGRSTFYDHHSSKEALLRHSVTPLLQRLADAAIGLEAPRLAAVRRHFWENRRLAARLLADRPGRIIRDQLVELITKALQPGAAPGPVPLSLLAISRAAAQLALIEAWLSGHHSCTAEQLAAGMTSGSIPDRRR